MNYGKLAKQSEDGGEKKEKGNRQGN